MTEPISFLQVLPFVPPDVLCRIHEVRWFPASVRSDKVPRPGPQPSVTAGSEQSPTTISDVKET
jgi:hypothetical protein